MRVIHTFKKPFPFAESVAAIGVFDGMHRAHCRIVKAAVACARRRAVACVVVTFHPHPQGREQIYSLAHRLRLIEGLGADVCVVVRFTPSFARMAAEVFIEKTICGYLHAQDVYVGKNFRFGCGGHGTVALLERYAARGCFRVHPSAMVRQGGAVISSTRIRGLIVRGDLARAAQLLGRRVSIYGSVVPGDSIGRTLGFPTANICAHHDIIPAPGIYAVGVVVRGKTYGGVCYIGRRPTITAPEHAVPVVEVHIMRFSRNIYHRLIEVRFVKRLRGERRFSSPEMLRRQIVRDVAAARIILSSVHR